MPTAWLQNHSILGGKKAMEYLETAQQCHDYNFIGVRRSRVFRPIEDEPEFQQP